MCLCRLDAGSLFTLRSILYEQTTHLRDEVRRAANGVRQGAVRCKGRCKAQRFGRRGAAAPPVNLPASHLPCG